MQNLFTQFWSNYHIHVDASRRLANVMIVATTRLGDIAISTAQRSFHSQMQIAQALARAQDQNAALNAVRAALISRKPDEAMTAQKEAVRVFIEAQNEIALVMRGYTQQLCMHVDNDTSEEPTQRWASDAFLDPVENVTSLWRSAFMKAMELAQLSRETIATNMEEPADKQSVAGDIASVSNRWTEDTGKQGA
jgi:hypothetical protein